MVPVAVETVQAGSKPQAAVNVRISKGERHNFSASAPVSTRASPLEQGRAGGPVKSSTKLVDFFRSGSTRFEEKLSPYFT